LNTKSKPTILGLGFYIGKGVNLILEILLSPK